MEVVPLLEKFNAAACVDQFDLMTAYCSLGGDKAGGVSHGTDRVVAWTIASDLDAGLFPYRLKDQGGLHLMLAFKTNERTVSGRGGSVCQTDPTLGTGKYGPMLGRVCVCGGGLCLTNRCIRTLLGCELGRSATYSKWRGSVCQTGPIVLTRVNIGRYWIGWGVGGGGALFDKQMYALTPWLSAGPIC